MLLAQNTTDAQPRFDAFSDARFLNETELMAKVAEPLLLGVTVSVLHDTRPPEAVVPTDVRLFALLRLMLDFAP